MNSSYEIPTGQSNDHSLGTTILDLNNDCLLKTFRYLTVEEMLTASHACRLFRDVARSAFKYEWKQKMMVLSDENMATRQSATVMLKKFGQQLKNIYIHSGEKWSEYLFEMVLKKCSSEQLTEVNVSHQIFETNNIERFKNKFPNLEGLGIENTRDNIELDKHHFPTLQKLTLFGYPFENQHVVQFVRLHPQLKSLQLEYPQRLDKLRSLLESVDQHLPQLEQLELLWTTGDVKYSGYQPKFFKNLKRLKIYNFGGYLMQHLSISNEKVEQLEFEDGAFDSDTTDFICHYKEVKKLSIHDINSPFDYKDLLKLTTHLSKLSVFEISSRFRNINHQAIAEFVLRSKHLVSLTIEDRAISELQTDLRGKLCKTEWACNLRSNELKIRKLSNRNQ